MKQPTGMGRGRPRKPTALKVLQGGDTIKSRKRNEPTPDVGAPPCPKHLDGYARECWDRVVPLVLKLRVLTVVDGEALELMALAYADWRHALDTIRAEGATYKCTTETGVFVRAHPAVAQRNDAWRRYLAALTQFGLTPASRSKVEASPDQKQTAFDDWLQTHR